MHDLCLGPVRSGGGGELQRFAIAVVAVQQADVYMFDEPSSYLDVKQRLRAGAVIRELQQTGAYNVDGTNIIGRNVGFSLARAYHKSSQAPTKSIGAGIESCLYLKPGIRHRMFL